MSKVSRSGAEDGQNSRQPFYFSVRPLGGEYWNEKASAGVTRRI